ncbi:hypothetical protein ACFYUY_09050 [Kitasatospora sp. NPDC004745]|uniref:hypothetical protein n=1 Tax=unclassified Kitasatospora TaxID=2633591 RepID=UPI0033E3FF4B
MPRSLAAPALAGCLALAGAVGAPAAQAASTVHRPLPVPDVQYCAAVLGHVPGADGRAPLLGRACAPDSRSDALGAAVRTVARDR